MSRAYEAPDAGPSDSYASEGGAGGGGATARPFGGGSRVGKLEGGGATGALSASADRTAKMNQLVQNLFWKIALIILQLRLDIPPKLAKGSANTFKTNRWFNLELNDTDAYREDVRPWRTLDIEAVAAPMVIEVFLDVSKLKHNQSVVVYDSRGQRTRIEPTNGGRNIVLERWVVSLDAVAGPGSVNIELPTAYKKAIAVFKSAYTLACLLPAFKFRKRLANSRLNGILHRLNCRVLSREESVGAMGSSKGLGDSTKTFEFAKIALPGHEFGISVIYRSNCDFGVDDSDKLLSSQFFDQDTKSRAAWDQSRSIYTHQPSPRVPQQPVVGSASSRETGVTGGNTGSFKEAMGTSSGSQRPTPISRRQGEGIYFPRSFERNSSLQDRHAMARRPSVTFIQPFKAPSLSASPSSAIAEARRSSSGAGAAGRPIFRQESGGSPASFNSLRNQQNSSSAEQAGGVSVSPRPSSFKRYSSSFGSRRDSQYFSRAHASVSSQDEAVSAGSPLGQSGSVMNRFSSSGASLEGDVGEFMHMLDTQPSLSFGVAPLEELPSSESAYTSDRFKAAFPAVTSGKSPEIDQSWNARLARFHVLQSSHAEVGEALHADLASSSTAITRQPQAADEKRLIEQELQHGKMQIPHAPTIPKVDRVRSASISVPSSEIPLRTGLGIPSHLHLAGLASVPGSSRAIVDTDEFRRQRFASMRPEYEVMERVLPAVENEQGPAPEGQRLEASGNAPKNNPNDEDDLLFAMSDMITGNPH